MASVNKVILIGNLGRDPEVRYTASGTAVCELVLATNERWSDGQGNPKERTEWHRVIVWGRQGESAAKHLHKGRPVYVEGRIQTREWKDNDGAKRYSTEIVSQRLQFLGGKGQAPAHHQAATSAGPPPPQDAWVSDEEIPF